MLEIKIFRNFWSVSQNEEFLELSAEKLIELTTSDKLEVDSEELVFLAVKRWYNERPEERSANFHEVGFPFTGDFYTQPILIMWS